MDRSETIGNFKKFPSVWKLYVVLSRNLNLRKQLKTSWRTLYVNDTVFHTTISFPFIVYKSEKLAMKTSS